MEENKKNKRKSIAEWIAVFGHWSCRLFDNLQGA